MAEDALLEKIGKLIEPLRTQLYEQGANIVRLVQGQKRLEKRSDNLAQGQAQIKTVLETLEAGQKDIQEKLATTPDKADILDLKAEVVKKIKDHDARIDELEKEVGLPHPHKH